MRQMQQQRGFTLVEVMVTVVIMAIIGLASAAVVNAMMRTSEQSEGKIAELQQLQYAMLTIEQDLRQITARDNPTGVYLFYDDSRLGFVRSGWFNPLGLFPRSELQPVAYLIRDGNLVREHTYFVDVSIGTEFEERLLLPGVTSFEVSYIQSNGTTSKAESTRVLPAAIELTLNTETWGTINRVMLLNPVAEAVSEQP